MKYAHRSSPNVIRIFCMIARQYGSTGDEVKNWILEQFPIKKLHKLLNKALDRPDDLQNKLRLVKQHQSLMIRLQALFWIQKYQTANFYPFLHRKVCNLMLSQLDASLQSDLVATREICILVSSAPIAYSIVLYL